MRSLTPIAMVVMLGALATTGRAENDMDILLGELTFNGSGDKSEPVPAPARLPEPGAQRAPANREPDLPEPLTLGPPASDLVTQDSDDVRELREVPVTGIEDASSPARETSSTPENDSDTEFGELGDGQPLTDQSLQSDGVVSVAPPAAPESLPVPGGVAPPHHGPSPRRSAAMPAGPHAYVADASGHSHRRPNLPPPSTLRQYFHAKPCQRDVWSGYRHEVQMRCQHHHEHLHGTCDCFKPAYSPPVYRATGRNVCRGCDGPRCPHAQ